MTLHASLHAAFLNGCANPGTTAPASTLHAVRHTHPAARLPLGAPGGGRERGAQAGAAHPAAGPTRGGQDGVAQGAGWPAEKGRHAQGRGTGKGWEAGRGWQALQHTICLYQRSGALSAHLPVPCPTPCLQVTADELSYNGRSLLGGPGGKGPNFVPERAAVFIPPLEAHFPELTVRQTLEFAARVHGSLFAGAEWSSRLEVQVQIAGADWGRASGGANVCSRGQHARRYEPG